MAKAHKFPKTIYVTREGDGDEAYYNVRLPNDLDGVDESQVAAVYELSGTGIISVTREFERGKK